jgi:hypothetical protein
MKRWFTYTLCCPYSSALVCNVPSSSPQQFNRIYSTATLNYASSFKKHIQQYTHCCIWHTLYQSESNRLKKTSNKSRKFAWCGVCISFSFEQFIYWYIHLVATRLMTSTESAMQQRTDCGTRNPMTQINAHTAVDMRTWWSLFTGACNKVAIWEWCGQIQNLSQSENKSRIGNFLKTCTIFWTIKAGNTISMRAFNLFPGVNTQAARSCSVHRE